MLLLEFVLGQQLTIENKTRGVVESLKDVVQQKYDIVQKCLRKEGLWAPF